MLATLAPAERPFRITFDQRTTYATARLNANSQPASSPQRLNPRQTKTADQDCRVSAANFCDVRSQRGQSVMDIRFEN